MSRGKKQGNRPLTLPAAAARAPGVRRGRIKRYPESRMFVERTGRIDQMDCSADVDFWQLQGDEAIVRAALEMAVEYHVYQLGDRPDHLRLERSVVRIGNSSRSLPGDRRLCGDEVHRAIQHQGPGPVDRSGV